MMGEKLNLQYLSPDLPGGTVTFLFTDIEGSTELLDQLQEGYKLLLEKHREIIRAVCSHWNGHEVDSRGEEFFLSFPQALNAVCAATEAQRILAEQDWQEGAKVRVRMGLHTGQPWIVEGGYVGMDVHRAARIGNLGHGGQVLLSDATANLLKDDLMEGVGLLELGKYRLKGIPRPERIYQLEIEGLPCEFPPLKSPDAGLPPHNLPTQITPFVGRETELEALGEKIADPNVRLITIVAAGGMGKTRLVLAASERQIPMTIRTNTKVEARFPHGVYFVSLAPLQSPMGIVPAIAEALDFQILSGEGMGFGSGGETRTPKTQLLDYLRSKRLLLIMDNFEHLLEGAGLLSEIIGIAPEVKVLVTSRERLNLKGEQLFPLLGMRSPDLERLKTVKEIDHEAYSALALFLQSAQRVQPFFEIMETNLPDVVSICHLVDGMPLGIELAASWVNMLTVKEIGEEIQRSLDFLETELTDVDERHRSIRAVFDSTWDRMNKSERMLFEQLSVYQGSFTREAAEEVAGASLDELRKFTNRSLLQFDLMAGTYEMHRLLRQFGEERLAQNPEKEKAVLDRHSNYYCHLLAQLEPDLKGSRHMEAMAIVEADIENITAAWRWAVEQGQVELIVSVLEAMDLFYEYSGQTEEAKRAFRDATYRLPSSQSVDAIRLRVRLNNLVAGNIPESGMDQRKALIETNWNLLKTPALTQEDTRFEEAILHTLVGMIQDDEQESRHHFQRAYDLFESLNDRWQMARLLASMAYIRSRKADHEGAIDLRKKSLAIFRELGFSKGIAEELDQLSTHMVHHMDWDNAERYLHESLKISEEMGDRRTLGWTLLFIGYMRVHQGMFEDAYRVFNEALAVNEELGQIYSVVYANVSLAEIENHFGRYGEALARSLECQKQAEEKNYEFWTALCLLTQGKALMGEGEYKTAKERLQASIELCRELGYIRYITAYLSILIICMYWQEDYPTMKDVIHEELQISKKMHRLVDYKNALPALALLPLARGEVEQAIEYYAYATTHPYIANSCWYKDLVGRHIEAAAESLPPDVVAAAQERGRNLDPHEVIQELLLEMEAKEESLKDE